MDMIGQYKQGLHCKHYSGPTEILFGFFKQSLEFKSCGWKKKG